jgi:hypothetical protein
VITCRKIGDRIRKKKVGEKRKAPPRDLCFGSMPVKGRGRPNMDIPFSDEIARDLQDQGHHVPVLKEVLTVEKDIRIEAVLGKKSRQQWKKATASAAHKSGATPTKADTPEAEGFSTRSGIVPHNRRVETRLPARLVYHLLSRPPRE